MVLLGNFMGDLEDDSLVFLFYYGNGNPVKYNTTRKKNNIKKSMDVSTFDNLT